MALSSLNTAAAADAGRPIELLHPSTQVPIGIRFFVLGTDSQEFRRITRKQQAELLEKQKKTRRGMYMPTPEEREENELTLLVGLTKGWEETTSDGSVRNEIELNPGEFVPFTPEAVKKIYADIGFSWIREQIDSEIGDRRDFLPNAK
ncbi:MAG: hypothetical protein PHN84_14355 [Desulfuromonadaceae bacterium]|nr:hypothetical protein [Desulfuromonadaceae bacterium]MDD2855324.1 hypothetical protein [Desulfuromonadaceae bacterium]